MSDTEKSSAALDEPTATPSATSVGDSPTIDTEQQPIDFAFASASGSGLARGKRKVTLAPEKPKNGSAYTPTAIEVITPKSEYSNPFTGETVVETIRETETKPPESESPQGSSTAAEMKEEPETKPELKILPPAETKREGQSWETASEHPALRAASKATPSQDASTERTHRDRAPRGSSEGRPTFQPERKGRTTHIEATNDTTHRTRSRRGELSREDRPKREPRGHSSERSSHANTDNAKSAKPKGFFAWLKRLFGGSDGDHTRSNTAPARGSSQDGSRRRSRGGRGKNNAHGMRSNADSSASRRNENGPRQDEGERPRSRSRGNRGGRNRNGTRPEGQKSGGAI